MKRQKSKSAGGGHGSAATTAAAAQAPLHDESLLSQAWAYPGQLCRGVVQAWNHFWFTPADPATLGLLRICAGAMLLYTHLVWTIDLEAFLGSDSWLNVTAARAIHGSDHSWSYFWWLRSSAMLWVTHLAALVVFALLMVGYKSRLMAVLAWLASVAYAHRLTGALYGLDQINVMLAMYLMLGPTGDAFSLDRRLAARRLGAALPPAAPSVSANLAVRLVQVHMCVIYFFAGLAKIQGEHWWVGDALWGAFANLEYQSFDMTWMADWPVTMAIMTQTTVYWELLFPAIIWPRLTRPIVLAVAVPLHLGIGLMLGMMTFGLAMLIGCASFLPPEFVRRLFDRRSRG